MSYWLGDMSERVIRCQQAKGERSYHVFYQLCGSAEEMTKDLGLESAEKYRYLVNGECVSIPGIDDAKDFQHLCKSMLAIGIPKDDQRQVRERA